jgi:hypothetical protein
MPSRQPTATATIYQFKVTLRSIKPPIWRRIQVSSETTLSGLHAILQVAMGWFNCHLHLFEIQGIEYGEPEPAYDWHVQDEEKIKLSRVATKEKFKFRYLYDMGDDWEHDVLLEKILPADPNTSYPICIKGKRACPPEDCGGPWAYPDLLETLQNPDHPEHESMLEWVGGEFDPEAFDLERVNKKLENIWLR